MYVNNLKLEICCIFGKARRNINQTSASTSWSNRLLILNIKITRVHEVSIFKCQCQMQWSDLDLLKTNHYWSLEKFHVKKINLGPGLVNSYSPPLSVGFAVLADNRELISSHWRLMSLLTLPASGQIIPLFYIWTLLVFSYFFITTFRLRQAKSRWLYPYEMVNWILPVQLGACF